MSKKDDVFSMPLSAFDKQIAAVMDGLEQIGSQLAGLITMTAEERRGAQGRFRVGEAEALLSVLDAAERKPALFESLADKDFGADADSFEVRVLRDRLERVARLVPLAEALDKLNTQVGDTVLQLSGETRPVMLEAYAIAKSVARTDAKLRATIAPAIDYFAKIGRLAASTRKKNREKNA